MPMPGRPPGDSEPRGSRPADSLSETIRDYPSLSGPIRAYPSLSEPFRLSLRAFRQAQAVTAASRRCPDDESGRPAGGPAPSRSHPTKSKTKQTASNPAASRVPYLSSRTPAGRAGPKQIPSRELQGSEIGGGGAPAPRPARPPAGPGGPADPTCRDRGRAAAAVTLPAPWGCDGRTAGRRTPHDAETANDAGTPAPGPGRCHQPGRAVGPRAWPL